MATVRLSKSLQSEIFGIVMKMQGQEVSTLQKKYPSAVTDVLRDPDKKMVDVLEKALWGESYHLIDVVPQKWLRKEKTIRVQINDNSGNLLGRKSIYYSNDSVRFPPDTPTFIPIELTADKFLLEPDIEEHYRQYKQECLVVISKYDTIRGTINQILGVATSLNKAVEDFPVLMGYVPEVYKQKMAEVVVRAQRKEAASIVAQVDTSLLAAAYVKHRVSA